MNDEKIEHKWVIDNTYEFEKDSEGNLFIIKNDTNSELSVSKEKLPDNSVTKSLHKELEKKNLLK